jgi:hypothetical protein
VLLDKAMTAAEEDLLFRNVELETIVEGAVKIAEMTRVTSFLGQALEAAKKMKAPSFKSFALLTVTAVHIGDPAKAPVLMNKIWRTAGRLNDAEMQLKGLLLFDACLSDYWGMGASAFHHR